jgi:hypothetical protein
VLGGGKLLDSLHAPKEKTLLKPIRHSQLAKEPKTQENLWSISSLETTHPLPLPLLSPYVENFDCWLLFLVAFLEFLSGCCD